MIWQAKDVAEVITALTSLLGAVAAIVAAMRGHTAIQRIEEHSRQSAAQSNQTQSLLREGCDTEAAAGMRVEIGRASCRERV